MNGSKLVLKLSLLFSKVCCFNLLSQAGLARINVWLITCYDNHTSTSTTTTLTRLSQVIWMFRKVRWAPPHRWRPVDLAGIYSSTPVKALWVWAKKMKYFITNICFRLGQKSNCWTKLTFWKEYSTIKPRWGRVCGGIGLKGVGWGRRWGGFGRDFIYFPKSYI